MLTILTKRSLLIAGGLLLAVLVQLMLAQPAHAAAMTWSGGGDGTTISDTANWAGGVAPVDGDTLVFDSDTFDYSNYDTVLNNTSLTTIAGITLQGANDGSVEIGGNDLILTGDITDSASGSMFVTLNLNITLGANIVVDAGIGSSSVTRTLDLSTFTLTNTNGGSLWIQSDISGSGGLTLDGIASLYGNNTYTGPTQVNATGAAWLYDVNALGSNVGATTISAGGNLTMCTAANYPTQNMDISENITLSGGAPFNDIDVQFTCGLGGGDPALAGDITFSGTVTITGDIDVSAVSKNVSFSNLVDNSNAVLLSYYSKGTLTLNGTLQTPPPEDVQTIAKGDDNATTTVSVLNNQKYVINGTRGTVYVYAGGTLSGTGTVGDINVATDGTLAPGLSPGCLTSGNLTLAGNFNVEINGAAVCTEYDQTDVTGTVNVTGGTLNILRLSSYNPATAGATFIIINNDGSDVVTGTFTGLVEGAKTTVDGVEYTVSYVGGDGNDVTLTVAATPGAPDTGFSSTSVNFMFIALATLLATSGMVIAGRKL